MYVHVRAYLYRGYPVAVEPFTEDEILDMFEEWLD